MAGASPWSHLVSRTYWKGGAKGCHELISVPPYGVHFHALPVADTLQVSSFPCVAVLLAIDSQLRVVDRIEGMSCALCAQGSGPPSAFEGICRLRAIGADFKFLGYLHVSSTGLLPADEYMRRFQSALDTANAETAVVKQDRYGRGQLPWAITVSLAGFAGGCGQTSSQAIERRRPPLSLSWHAGSCGQASSQAVEVERSVHLMCSFARLSLLQGGEAVEPAATRRARPGVQGVARAGQGKGAPAAGGGGEEARRGGEAAAGGRE